MTNFLVEALQNMGIYYTPPHILALAYGDGKTHAYATLAANPPFGGTMSSDRDPESYITEDGKCSNCGAQLDFDDMGAFEVEESGVQPGTVDGYAVHWAYGVWICPNCSDRLPFETSS